MPTYSAPGVYVEELPSAAQPIEGVGTSTAGFIGFVDDGVPMPVDPARPAPGPPPPADAAEKAKTDWAALDSAARYEVADAGSPVPLTGWEDFTAHFGEIDAEHNAVLARAVQGFFLNGGARCWVARVDADPPSAADLTSVLGAFAKIDEIGLVAFPGAVDPVVQGALVDHCEHLGDRFAILDGIRTGTLTPAAVLPAPTNGSPRASSYCAVYFPWLDVGATRTEGSAVVPDFVPPSGHVAGLVARVDAARGVHKAPANEVVRGVVGLETVVTREAQGPLNDGGVNAIRPLRSGIRLYGARTRSAETDWRYVSVRRTFDFVRESIDEGLQWVVFEPNGPELWSKIRRNVTAFLTTVWESGALFGDTPEQAFFVACDESTNRPSERDLGRIVTRVGIAVVRPAEFVVFRVSQFSGPGS